MLQEFLRTNRTDLIGRCEARVLQRGILLANDSMLKHGVPVFIDELIDALHAQPAATAHPDLGESVPAAAATMVSRISSTASRHGREMLQHGFSIAQVVHDYGDLCQAITELAAEQSKTIQSKDFRILNWCLDNAIAYAVTEYNFAHQRAVANHGAEALAERLESLANELRGHFQAAALALTARKSDVTALPNPPDPEVEQAQMTFSPKRSDHSEPVLELSISLRSVTDGGWILSVRNAAGYGRTIAINLSREP